MTTQQSITTDDKYETVDAFVKADMVRIRKEMRVAQKDLNHYLDTLDRLKYGADRPFKHSIYQSLTSSISITEKLAKALKDFTQNMKEIDGE